MITAEPKPSPRPSRPREARPRLPEAAWTPLTVAFITLVLGLGSLAAGRPMLFPSLAPASVAHVRMPRAPNAALWRTLAGQFVAIGAAYLAVWLFDAAAAPAALSAGVMPASRVWASVVGIFISLLVQTFIDAVEPASAATLVLITLGAFKPIARDFWTLVLGVLVMAALGEAARRWRIAQEDREARYGR